MTSKTKILVVGGAGYIGSHVCKYLSQKGYEPLVLDNLSYGHPQAVKDFCLIRGGMADAGLLDSLFSEHDISAVMHLAAFTYVGESVENPAKYYQNNVAEVIALLDAMRRHKVMNFIFSSTCAIYGEPQEIPMGENHPKNPINPYGRSKLMVEQILADFEAAYGLKSISLRYFNAAGADPEGELGEDHRPETHLIPLVIEAALGKRECISVFGDDYSTRDGSCIRDYIHVNDLAQAHQLALERLISGKPGGAYNLGNGLGYSVREVIETTRKISGRSIVEKIAPRRAGDPPELIGSSEKAIAELGWKPEFYDLETIIKTAWDWHKKHPDGYR